MKLFESILDQIDVQHVEQPQTESMRPHNDFRWRVEVRFPDGERFQRTLEYAQETMMNVMEAFSEIKDYQLDFERYVSDIFQKERVSEYTYFGIDFNMSEDVSIEKIYSRLVFPICQLAVNVRNILFFFADNENDDYQVCVSDLDAIVLTGIKEGKVRCFQRTNQGMFYIFRFFAYMSTEYMCSSNPFDTELSPEHCYYDLIFPVIFNPEWKKFWRSLPKKDGMRFLSGDKVYGTSSYVKYPETQYFDIYAKTSKEMIVKIQGLSQMLFIADFEYKNKSDVLIKSVASNPKLFSQRLFENVQTYTELEILWPALKKVERIIDDCNAMRTPDTYQPIIDELKRICTDDHDIVC